MLELLFAPIVAGAIYYSFWGIYDGIVTANAAGDWWALTGWIFLAIFALILFVFLVIAAEGDPLMYVGIGLGIIWIIIAAFMPEGLSHTSVEPLPTIDPEATALLDLPDIAMPLPTVTPLPTQTPVPTGMPMSGCWLSKSRGYFIPVRDRFGNLVQLNQDQPIPCSDGHGTKIEGSWGTDLWCYCLEPTQALPQSATTISATTTTGCYLSAAANPDPFWLVVADSSSPVGWNWYQPGNEAGLVGCDPNQAQFLPPGWTGLDVLYCQCGGP